MRQNFLVNRYGTCFFFAAVACLFRACRRRVLTEADWTRFAHGSTTTSGGCRVFRPSLLTSVSKGAAR